jgi:hypothetical protein
MLTRESFLAFKPQIKEVALPNGETAHVREMSAGDRDWIQFDILKDETRHRFRPAVLALSLCDETGSLLFDAHKPEDLKAVETVPATVAEPLIEAALVLSGLAEEDQEEMGKDSGSPLLNDSP